MQQATPPHRTVAVLPRRRRRAVRLPEPHRIRWLVPASWQAMDCITYLKEKKCAPETFIPLDTIRARPVREAMRQLGGSKKPAQDVISAPEQYLKAVQFAVGDAVICDSLEEARQLAYHSSGEERFKVVTTDGTLINKAGLITGGSSPQEKARANKWNQKEHDALKVEQEKIRRELDELGLPMAAEEKELALRHAVGSKQQEVQTAQSDLDLTKAKLTKHKKELTTIGSSLETARTQLVDLESKVDKGKAEASELQERADAEEDRIFSKFSASLGIASVREYEEKHVRAAREREAQLLSLKQQQSKLKAQLLFEGRKDVLRC
jgi:structural maintenance of chromosome 1